MEKTGFSIEDRVLCSDQACIGTVGPDKHCKVCHKLYEGEEPLPKTADNDSNDIAASGTATKQEEIVVPTFGVDDWSSDPNARQCCWDAACIGILGPDGQCGTCGRKS